jgi:glycosyltransferase involved in cell wall biosynthesis
VKKLRIAMLGTRGVPARYGGFETAVEEVGSRLAARGHEVIVYCRRPPGDRDRPERHLGMRLVHLPAARRKTLETLSHTALSAGHAVLYGGIDVAVVFNAANAPFIPLLHARGIPVATHVDGLEWKRAKWGGAGRKFYRVAEGLAVRWSDVLISDAQGIADYYEDEFQTPSELIAYGAPILRDLPSDRLPELGLVPGKFHLVVARFEPENHVRLAVEGYVRSDARLPLVLVGSAPYADEYAARIQALMEEDDRVLSLGGVWDQTQLDQLYAHAASYIHGHSVGGTNPSLLRAMGAGTTVLAFDVGFNREVLGEDGLFWSDAGDLKSLITEEEDDVADHSVRGMRLQERAALCYRWEQVADRYEQMCLRLAAGRRLRGQNRIGFRRILTR